MAHSTAFAPRSLFPASILERLSDRGVASDRLPGETPRSHQDRLDTELMALFRDTHAEEAFDALYEHARGRVFQWVRWLVRQRRCSVDPIDLLQDTFVNVYRYAHSFRSDTKKSFRSWVRTIAANALRRALSVLANASSQGLPADLQEPVDPAVGPEVRMIEGEETVALKEAWVLFLQQYVAAYDSLSDRDRRALALVEVRGFTYAAAATELSVGSSNMKMIMLRSRRRLQKHMRAAMFGREPKRLRMTA
jgi:RNA polymerase sigma factor (sigma-70 family)